MSHKQRACCLLILFVAVTASFSGCTHFPIRKLTKKDAAKKNGPGAGDASSDELRRVRDSEEAYAKLRENPKALPQIEPTNGQSLEYATLVYSGIFCEALKNRDFDLIDRAADEARESKEKTIGGVWKLERIYDGIDQPQHATTDAEWEQHAELLQEWMEENPDSDTAPVALAAYFFNFAWNARGNGYAGTVSEKSRDLFIERLGLARNFLATMSGKTSCPKWYSLMLQIALSQNWEREDYDLLWENAVQYEPTWYEYYRQRAIYLLPKWHGEPGELDAYASSFATRKRDSESAKIYFMIIQCAGAADQNEKAKPVAHYEVFKRGFREVQQQYGATARGTSIAFEKAALAKDRTFAQELILASNQQPPARK